MNEYLKAQNISNNAVIANAFNSDEFNRFSRSDYRWADNRFRQFRHRTVKKREISHDSILKPNGIRTVRVNESYISRTE